MEKNSPFPADPREEMGRASIGEVVGPLSSRPPLQWAGLDLLALWSRGLTQQAPVCKSLLSL